MDLKHNFSIGEDIAWSQRITLARANPDLALIYVQSIRDEAEKLIITGLCGRDENRAVIDACDWVLGSYHLGQTMPADEVENLDELDALICDEEPGDDLELGRTWAERWS